MQRDVNDRAVAPGDAIVDRSSKRLATWLAVAIARGNQKWELADHPDERKIRRSELKYENGRDVPCRRIGESEVER